ncbi:TetR/AcrR family transcriptional regulator [Streptomyces sp. NPDC006332]|uniref:TetR/AcrR family transcriptional regulator n=1 Tax=Streptomyces sp. NPDC006332 TaxID=3155456 RepID=UPI0033AC600E
MSKTTLYRRWPTKQELFIDAVRRRVDFSFAVSDQGSFRADVLEALRLVSTGSSGTAPCCATSWTRAVMTRTCAKRPNGSWGSSACWSSMEVRVTPG